MEQDLQAIVVETVRKLEAVTNRSDWDNLKATVLGPNGNLTQIAKGIGSLAKEDRPAFGQALNRAKKEIESGFKDSLSLIEGKADLLALGNEAVSYTHLRAHET